MMPNVGDENFVSGFANCGHHWTTDNGQFHGDMQFVCQSSVVTDTTFATITLGRNTQPCYSLIAVAQIL